MAVTRASVAPTFPVMAKVTTLFPDGSLTVRERMLLFAVAVDIDPEAAGVTSDTAKGMLVKGLIDRDTGGKLSLTEHGRASLRRLLPDL
jgi:hypothetical protein